MKNKTMCMKTDELFAMRFEFSTSPALASAGGSVKGSSVSTAPTHIVDYSRERFAGIAPFFATDVAVSAAGRSPI